MTKMAVFASGNGSNAINLYRYFKRHDHIQVSKIYINNPGAGVIARAIEYDIPYHIFTRKEMNNGMLLEKLEYDGIDVIILAGFLWKIPIDLISAYHGRIWNIHPSLLPKFGGKGMYGMKVHEAVIAAGEKESGITIHEVNEVYDAGAVVFQEKILLDTAETPETLAHRIHLLEHRYFPEVIEKEILRKNA